jgi:hypothetical protein
VELVGLLIPDVPDLFALVCAAKRSVNRFVVPRIAPRLEAGAPGAPEVADCAFRAWFVLAVEEFWPEPEVVEPEEDDEDVEVDAEDDELMADDPPPTDFVPPPPKPPEALRLPRKRGAISAANFSAVTIPLTRIVRSRSPAAMVAVRNDAVSGFAFPACCRAIHAAPPTATIASAMRSQRQRCRGFPGTGRTSSGAEGGFTGAAVPGTVLGSEALLILKGRHLQNGQHP